MRKRGDIALEYWRPGQEECSFSRESRAGVPVLHRAQRKRVTEGVNRVDSLPRLGSRPYVARFRRNQPRVMPRPPNSDQMMAVEGSGTDCTVATTQSAAVNSAGFCVYQLAFGALAQ